MVSSSSSFPTIGKHIAKYTKQRCSKCRRKLKSRRRRTKSKNRSSNITRHGPDELDYTVDIADLLFTRKRNFLVKNNGQKVRIDDLKGKAVVLIILPFYGHYLNPGDVVDMIQAYEELSPMGNVEFVTVPVKLLNNFKKDLPDASQEAIYNYLYSTMPWPAVPFSDIAACGHRVVKNFSVSYAYGDLDYCEDPYYPYWVVIDPTNTVVATRDVYPSLFKVFNGAELYPLLLERNCSVCDDHRYGDHRRYRKRHISSWDQLLASPTRDFLLASNGDQVPISSLKDKVIGLYFCDNIAHPPRMDLIKKVYQEAKSHGYAFEIVQINFHYRFFNARQARIEDMPVPQCKENINWLTLPFKDPSCRKIQRVFNCDIRDQDFPWAGDCLVIVDPRQGDLSFEFSGAEIFQQFGFEGYPFTRQSLFERELRKAREVRLQTLFPPCQCYEFGKRVLVLFAKRSECESSTFVTMVRSKYREQQDEAEGRNKFEVVYVSTDDSESSHTKCVEGMPPWLVDPYSKKFAEWCSRKIFGENYRHQPYAGIRAAAFDVEGELIARERYISPSDIRWRKSEYPVLQFPFFSECLEAQVRKEISATCSLDKYFSDSDSDSDADGEDIFVNYNQIFARMYT